MQIPQTEVIFRGMDAAELLRTRLVPGEYVIGRGAEAELRLDDGLLAEQHARLTINFDHAFIEDLGSSSGTRVNGKPVAEVTRLWPNQKIQVGSTTLELHRLKSIAQPDVSLSPTAAVLQAVLPEEFLRARRYEIGDLVAQGGMGAILSAQEATIERRVAMKVMLNTSSPDDLVRFIAEAKVTGQLEHPNIVPVHELGVDENEQVFYTMKFVGGITLRKVLELIASRAEATAKKYALPMLLTVYQKVCDAVAFAHSRGVIHRDLKPENIMLGDFGEVLVMDWGLAKVLGAQDPMSGEPRRLLSAGLLNGTATLTGSIMGTPHYMSPEQARGEIERLDVRTDVYALGAILYQILALRTPVEGHDVQEVLESVRTGRVQPLARGAKAGASHLPGGRIPESLAAVAMKALSIEPADRYPSVPDLQADVLAYQSGFATRAEKAGAFKQFTLFLKRHKTASFAAAIILLLTIGFLVKVVSSERQATAHLARLKGTAPTFEQHARALIEKSTAEPELLKEALANADHALELAPDRADYRLLRAGILQAMLRLEEARAGFANALKLDPGNARLQENLLACEQTLAARQSDGTYPPAALGGLAASLRQQGRGAEALAVMRQFDKVGTAMLALWQEKIERAGIKDKIILSPDGSLRLGVWASRVAQDLSVLQGIPFTSLDFTHNEQLVDITPLRGMPLRELGLGSTGVMDLSALRGMALEKLALPKTVSDISMLRGMPIRDLLIDGDSKVKDFSVLREMPLTDYLQLRIVRTFSDLSLLQGKRIGRLNISQTGVRDLAPLRTMTLRHLALPAEADLRDLSVVPLQSLKVLSLDENPTVRDLSALRGSDLEELWLARSGVKDLSVLASLPKLRWVVLVATAVSDLSPLASLKLERLTLERCTAVRTVAPLANMSTLKILSVPPAPRDLELLRPQKGLTWIGYGEAPFSLEAANARAGEKAAFWKMHDLEQQVRAAAPGRKLRPSAFPLMKQRHPEAVQFGESWYCWFRSDATWEEARVYAEELGGHLATLTTAEEDRFIHDHVMSRAYLLENRCGWIGGTTDQPGGEWRWVTGEPWGFTRWVKHEGRVQPSGLAPGTQTPETVLALANFGGNAITNGSRMGWNDLTPDHKNVAGFLVEWDE